MSQVFDILGATAVGKASIFLRYVDNLFEPTYYRTNRTCIWKCKSEFKNRSFTLSICTTAGPTNLSEIEHHRYTICQAIILVCDVNNEA